MSLPKPTTDQRTHERLTALRNGLLRLHKTLLDSERGTYERNVARVTSPGHMLDLVMNDPWFTWMRELSGLVVRIDELLDSKEHSAVPEDAVRFIADARALLTPAEEGRGFEKHYYEALQRDPDVVLAHGAMMKTFSMLEK